MAYRISSDCINCNTCLPICPTGAISVDNNRYWIDSALCNNCEGYYDEPQCAAICPEKASLPTQPKRGRIKAIADPVAVSSHLFSNGKNNAFASSIVLWESCNLLAQGNDILLEKDSIENHYYLRTVNQGKGSIRFQFNEYNPNKKIDIRATCLHLIFAALATNLDRPWEQEFVISDRQIEEYLGLDKRKGMSKPTKLAFIRTLVEQPCQIRVSMHWPAQGRVRGFALEDDRIWHLVETIQHFHEDEMGSRQLVGLTFKVRAGNWSQHFLNKQGCKEKTAFYQYGSLPRALLLSVMGTWQQHEGAVRLMLWLLFKTRLGEQQRISVPTLMRIAYGEKRVDRATVNREERKRLLRMFESDLEVLANNGLKPIFDPITYPRDIQPLWVKLADVPDDAEAALEFWIGDANSNSRLTDASPRGKWQLLMNARILAFELQGDWEQPADASKKKANLQQPRSKKQRFNREKKTLDKFPSLTGEQIVSIRKEMKLSQRDLAEKMGKSQSWIRDIENERFYLKSEDRVLLHQVLGLGENDRALQGKSILKHP